MVNCAEPKINEICTIIHREWARVWDKDRQVPYMFRGDEAGSGLSAQSSLAACIPPSSGNTHHLQILANVFQGEPCTTTVIFMDIHNNNQISTIQDLLS